MIELFTHLLRASSSSAHLTICGELIPQNCNRLLKSLDSTTANCFSFNDFVADISQYILCSHIYISTSSWEGFPNSLITAAASGCVPVFTTAGDSHRILTQNVFILKGELECDLRTIFSAICYARSTSSYKRALSYRKQIETFMSSFSNIESIYSSYL